MAVQAQYPSNVLFLNRNGQGDQDCSLQPLPGGVFLDQSHAGVNNGGGVTNQRKRARETCGGPAGDNIAGSSSSMNVNVHSLSMQSLQPPQLVDLSQLRHNSVSKGLRLSSTDQQNHPHSPHQQHQKALDNSSAILSLFNEDLIGHVRQQSEEIDQLLQAQGEQLRRTLAQKRQRHYHALLGAAEESLARRLRDKEAEVEKARRWNAELQSRAVQLGAQAQVWQAKARSQEAAAASLRAHLQQAMMGGGAAHDRKFDICGAAVLEGHSAEDAGSVYVDPNRPSSSEPSCKVCRRRAATVLMLPCRHLSACTECERVATACPLCSCARSCSIEVCLP